MSEFKLYGHDTQIQISSKSKHYIYRI